jgi:hypothetical protein
MLQDVVTLLGIVLALITTVSWAGVILLGLVPPLSDKAERITGVAQLVFLVIPALASIAAAVYLSGLSDMR